MAKKKIAFVLGIRPDIIRAVLILEHLKKNKDIETVFIWSGQHYSDNLKDIFFRELDAPRTDIELNCGGEDDADITACTISKLSKVMQKIKPEICVFLGDTNTVLSCVAPLQLNIPIAHIEACMRCYDWRMPEERNRTMVDHASDILYAYLPEYKEAGVREGLNPKNIIVVGNPIVDILNKYYFDKKEKFDKKATPEFFKERKIDKGEYYVMTCHRRENVTDKESIKAIFNLVNQSPYPVFLAASYRTQKLIKQFKIKLSKQIIMVDPIGYDELLTLVVNSRGVLCDSGTLVEECSVLNVPCCNLKISSERPEIYEVGGCVKFDPTRPEKYPAKKIFAKMESLVGKKWKHKFGDGKTSERIAKDLIKRVLGEDVRRHKPKDYHFQINRSYQEDRVKI